MKNVFILIYIIITYFPKPKSNIIKYKLILFVSSSEITITIKGKGYQYIF